MIKAFDGGGRKSKVWDTFRAWSCDQNHYHSVIRELGETWNWVSMERDPRVEVEHMDAEMTKTAITLEIG
ncbi:hypothetical protein PM082_007039 [Marasmius tenuissimus]|nr:hypothetical protein PM082_007039 [Marasmius tenuissimus]